MITAKNYNKGFTLLELLIALAIIGVLITLVFPNYQRSRNLAMFSSCKSNQRTIASALEGYSTDHNGQYPSALTVLTEGGRPYIRKLPACRACGNTSSYIEGYTSSNTPQCFTLRCAGNYHSAVDIKPNYPGYSPVRGGFDNEFEEKGPENSEGTED